MSLHGSATWAGGSVAQVQVRGDVFLTPHGRVDGLFLMVARSEIAPEPLRVATLNSDGILDFDRNRAFLFTDRAQKLAHPVNYTCRRSPG